MRLIPPSLGIDNWPPATSPPITSAYSIYRRHHQSEPKRRRRRKRGVFIFIKATFFFYSIFSEFHLEWVFCVLSLWGFKSACRLSNKYCLFTSWAGFIRGNNNPSYEITVCMTRCHNVVGRKKGELRCICMNMTDRVALFFTGEIEGNLCSFHTDLMGDTTKKSCRSFILYL